MKLLIIIGLVNIAAALIIAAHQALWTSKSPAKPKAVKQPKVDAMTVMLQSIVNYTDTREV